MMETGQFYDFGPFRLDARKHLLLRANQTVALTPKALETLILLVQNSGRVLEKDELMNKLWPDAFVEEANLAQHISALRKVLGESPGDHHYIVTVPGRGYEFVAEVRNADEDADELIVEKRTVSRVIVEEAQGEEGTAAGPNEISAANKPVLELPSVAGADGQGPSALVAVSAPWGAGARPVEPQSRLRNWILLGLSVVGLAALLMALNAGGLRDRLLGRPSVTPIRSLAVLPLVNLSGDPEQEYFADGMTDELITDLAQVRALRVISRTSVMRFKGAKKSLPEIARELNVDAVLEGTVVRSGGRVRITAQLIRAATDQHLWARAYERDFRDVLTLQAEVAQAVADQVQAKLTPQEKIRLANARSVNPEAHEAYLLGRFEWNKRTPESLKNSFVYYRRALEKEPGYALAYVGLAETYNVADDYWQVAPKETMPQAKAAAKKALELDDSLAEAHSALATALITYDWDWAGAEREYKRAFDLDPNYAPAHYAYGLFYLTPLGKLQEAVAEIRKALELDPLSLIVNANLGFVYDCERQHHAAIQQEQKTLELDPNFPRAHFILGAIYEEQEMYEQAIAEAQKYSLWGGVTPDQASEVRKALARQGANGYWKKNLALLIERSKVKYIEPSSIAYVYARLGDKDQAFKWLEKGYDDREDWVRYFQVDPSFDNLRGDPRYQDLARRMGLLP